MVDSKTTALTELTTFSGDETFYVVEDDGGTPASRRVTVENLAAGLAPRIAGHLLARATYAPGSDTTIGTTTSATQTDVDATNLVVTFTVPPSGAVLVTLDGMGDVSTAQAYRWGLRESTTLIDEYWISSGVTTARYSVTFLVTGLTPGDSKTYKWGYRVAGGATTRVYGGPSYGKAVMLVQAA